LAARRVGNIERASVVPLMSADQFLESLEAASEIGYGGFGPERGSTKPKPNA
jgi:hypothetical protein